MSQERNPPVVNASRGQEEINPCAICSPCYGKISSTFCWTTVRITIALLLALTVGAGNMAFGHDVKPSHKRQHVTPKTNNVASGKISKTKEKKRSVRRPGTSVQQGNTHTAKEKLTRRQEEIRAAFNECISRSTEDNPVEEVKRFVFEEQKDREHGFWGVIEAFRGSPVHHGHEVCLGRAYGLATFRTVRAIRAEHGKLLVRLVSPDIFFPRGRNGKDEVPLERRYARAWVVDYVKVLAKDFRSQFGVPLRIGSVIRDAATQNMLVRRGLSPADCRYEFLCSTHTTGSAIDLGTKDVSIAQQRWLRDRLLADQRKQKIFFIRENSHFHLFIIPPQFMGEE